MIIFVNRDEELEHLETLVRGGSRIWITGLRGYGKTALVKRLAEVMIRKGVPTIYIDCGLIFSPSDLLLYLHEVLEGLGLVSESHLRELELLALRSNPKEALENLFEFSWRSGVRVLIFDEVSTLIQRFSLLKPYKGFGGSMGVGQHLKSLLNKFSELSVVFVDTSTSALYELFRKYSSPLFKEFTYKITLEPLGLEDSVNMIKKLLDLREIKASDELIYLIAQYSSGVPTYIKMLVDLVKQNLSLEEFEDIFFESLRDGILNDYFTSLFEKFTSAEQEVLLLLSRGLQRFNEIDSKAINAAKALELLKLKGVIYKLQIGRKEIYYGLKDRLFAAWLSQNEFPRLHKLSREKIKIFYLGFEALVREVFRTLKREVKIKDALNRELTIKQVKQVSKYMGSLGEIDLIAIGDRITYIGEIYAGKGFPKKKIHQLLKNIKIAEDMGYKNIIGLAISFKEFTNTTKQTVKEIIKEKEIYLINSKALKEIAKASEFKI